VMDESLIVAYLKEYKGDVHAYHKYREHKQRPGQAFFNALADFDKYLIRGSLRDPFYKENLEDIEQTIEWLMYMHK
jgi:hypothetical protein